MGNFNKCEKCGSGQVDVFNTRDRGSHIFRRRRCRDCGHKFSTREIREEEFEVMSREKRREVFEGKFLEIVRGYVRGLPAREQSLFFSRVIGESVTKKDW